MLTWWSSCQGRSPGPGVILSEVTEQEVREDISRFEASYVAWRKRRNVGDEARGIGVKEPSWSILGIGLWRG